MTTPDDPDFIPEGDPRFVPYPDEPSMGTAGPTDANAEVITDADED